MSPTYTHSARNSSNFVILYLRPVLGNINKQVPNKFWKKSRKEKKQNKKKAPQFVKTYF